MSFLSLFRKFKRPGKKVRMLAQNVRAFSSESNPFVYQDLFETPNKPDIPYRKLEGSEAIFGVVSWNFDIF